MTPYRPGTPGRGAPGAPEEPTPGDGGTGLTTPARPHPAPAGTGRGDGGTDPTPRGTHITAPRSTDPTAPDPRESGARTGDPHLPGAYTTAGRPPAEGAGGSPAEPVERLSGRARPTGPADLAVTGATVLTPEGPRPGTLLVDGGRIRAVVPPGTRVTAGETIDARGLHLVPGVIDLHVHFDVPGISLETDFRTGTRSAAAGGVTFVVEHPFSDPPTTTAARYRDKRRSAAAGAVVDFGLWGALTRPSLDEMEGQHALGAPGFKAFLPENDMDFPPATEADLLTGMTTAARLGARVLVHAEDRDALTAGEAALRARRRTDVAALLEARPPSTEIDAVRKVLRLATRTGCAVHLVHLSTPEAVDLVTQARAAGLDATCEVTAHHLLLNAAELPALGGFAVCAPPLRDERHVERLWDRVRAGHVQAVVSDHCPYGRADKLAGSDDVFRCPFGIQSVQEYVPLVVSEALRRGMPLADIVALMTEGPARICGADGSKGALRPGMDADFALLDLDSPWVVSAERQQHAEERWSPYDGRTSTVRVVRTVVRGRTVALDGAVTASGGSGRYLPLSGPARQPSGEAACRI
ncbi:allantoinase AllB [Streptomyces sp. NPDC051018]|uniref:allantoinase AllB n=1 Tax=Streptomyces sp. NPDC051018 TaxID=3365639 RepID=UPI0037A91FB6